MKKMFRLPVIFVLIITTFAGSIPEVQNEASNKTAPKVAPLVAENVNAKIETTNISANNDNATIAPSVKPIENKKETLNDAKTAIPPKVINDNETVPQHIAAPNETDKHKKCNSTMESDDMQGCYVSPSDIDELADGIKAQTPAESTTIVNTVPKKTEATKKDSETSKPLPDKNKKIGDKDKTDDKGNDEKVKADKENDEKVNTDKKKDDKLKNEKEKNDEIKSNKKNETITTVLINSTEATSQVSYEITSVETSKDKNTNDTGDSSKPSPPPVIINGTATASNSVIPLAKAANVETGNVAAVKTADQNKSMSSEIIALVTAISFGVAIGIVYIGMIVWRRYVEYRYGHRELLVNELEFDTNDLRHFEL